MDLIDNKSALVQATASHIPGKNLKTEPTNIQWAIYASASVS